MTIRLLATYNQFSPNTIVTLATATENALVAGGNATTDLSGGVPFNYKLPANNRQNNVSYAPDGVPLGISDSTGKILSPFAGIAAPGAPTGLTLTAIAGGVLATLTAPVSTGGTAITGYEVTLSTGQVRLGETTTIAINAPAGVPVTATAKAINGYDKSAASAASNSATPTGVVVPVAPQVVTGAAITGAPQVGVPLAITAATFSGAPTPTITRVIKMDGATVATGNGSTSYTPVTGDIGKIPSVTDTATNASGSVYSTGAGAAVIASAGPTLLPLDTLLAVDGDSMSTYGSGSIPSWIARALEKTNGRFRLPAANVLSISGTGFDLPAGNSISDRAATMDARGATVQILGSITNQLVLSSDTASALISKVQAYFAARFANNANLKYMIICKIPPRSDSTWTGQADVATRESVRVAYNAALDTWAASEPRLRVVTYTGWVSTSTTDPAVVGTLDGLHQNYITADTIMGDSIAAVLNTLIVQTSINASAANLITDWMMTQATIDASTVATGTNVTGVLPSGWTINNSGASVVVACSVVDAVDLDGIACKAIQLDISGTADANLRFVQVGRATPVSNGTVNGSNGSEVWGDYSIDAGAAFVSTPYILVSNLAATSNRGVTAKLAPIARTGRMRSQPNVYAATQTSQTAGFGIQLLTGGTISCRMKIFHPSLRQI